MADTNGTNSLTPEERALACLMARAFAADLLRLPKLPLRREVIAQCTWILDGPSESSTPVQD